jgi:hypothetical protein
MPWLPPTVCPLPMFSLGRTVNLNAVATVPAASLLGGAIPSQSRRATRMTRDHRMQTCPR